MKKVTLLLLFAASLSHAQVPLQITGNDCNGNWHDLFAELDSGKASVIFIFMDNCGICPPAANVIQVMMNHILSVYPGMITGYAMPYDDITTCTATSTWCGNYGQLFAPYDSGAHQVANYGGFGMPTVVLLGGAGANERVMFSSVGFANGDTTVMRDSILALFNSNVGISNLSPVASSFSVYPNPFHEKTVLTLSEYCFSCELEIYDALGEKISAKKFSGLQTEINRVAMNSGIYFFSVRDGKKVIASGKLMTEE